jgi:hypothetical protein
VAVKNRPENLSLFGFSKEATVVSYIPKKENNVILILSLHFMMPLTVKLAVN